MTRRATTGREARARAIPEPPRREVRLVKGPLYRKVDFQKDPLYRKVMPLSLDQINRLNPWWTDPTWGPGDDVHLLAAAESPFTWDPRPFDEQDIESGSVFTLRGPRQSGKTTLTKRLIAERVRARLARRTCFLTLQTISAQDEASGSRRNGLATVA